MIIYLLVVSFQSNNGDGSMSDLFLLALSVGGYLLHFILHWMVMSEIGELVKLEKEYVKKKSNVDPSTRVGNYLPPT